MIIEMKMMMKYNNKEIEKYNSNRSSNLEEERMID